MRHLRETRTQRHLSLGDVASVMVYCQQGNPTNVSHFRDFLTFPETLFFLPWPDTSPPHFPARNNSLIRLGPSNPGSPPFSGNTFFIPAGGALFSRRPSNLIMIFPQEKKLPVFVFMKIRRRQLRWGRFSRAISHPRRHFYDFLIRFRPNQIYKFTLSELESSDRLPDCRLETIATLAKKTRHLTPSQHKGCKRVEDSAKLNMSRRV